MDLLRCSTQGIHRRGVLVFTSLWIVLALPCPVVAAPTGDGMFATFQVRRGLTTIGEFSCRLEFQKVPRTVANFVDLAEGSRPFIDLQQNRIARRRFFDNTIFHRVEPGFVIQGGSPDGSNNGGPGYTFRDEFDATLRHDKAGVLSMANGGLHSNGSQFFVTLAATPGLNNLHSVFGEVVEGLNIVTNVRLGDVITSLTIFRNGAAAQAFDAAAHGLPVVDDADPVLQPVTGGFQLSYAQPANAEFFVFHSDQLASWSRLSGQEMLGPNPTPTPRDVTAVTTGKAQNFFTAGRVRYPDVIHTPPSVAGKRLTLANVSSAGTFTLQFQLTNSTAAAYALTIPGQAPETGSVTSPDWTQDAYRGRLIASLSGLAAGNDPITQTSVSYVFTSPTGGTAGGYFFTLFGQSLPLAGTFTLSDL